MVTVDVAEVDADVDTEVVADDVADEVGDVMAVLETDVVAELVCDVVALLVTEEVAELDCDDVAVLDAELVTVVDCVVMSQPLNSLSAKASRIRSSTSTFAMHEMLLGALTRPAPRQLSVPSSPPGPVKIAWMALNAATVFEHSVPADSTEWVKPNASTTLLQVTLTFWPQLVKMFFQIADCRAQSST